MRYGEILAEAPLNGRTKVRTAGKFYYHMTSSRNLVSIHEKGLMPGDYDRSNWGFGHEEGKVFFGKTYDQAKYYGDILKHGQAGGPPPLEPHLYYAMLRVPARKLTDVTQDPETRSDVYVERIVPPRDIQIEWGDHGWYWLLDVDVRAVAMGDWDDEPDDDEVDDEDESVEL